MIFINPVVLGITEEHSQAFSMTDQSNLKLSGPICVCIGVVSAGLTSVWEEWLLSGAGLLKLLRYVKQQRPAHVSAAGAVVTTTFNIVLSFVI